jgi:hypothetical protein
MRRLSPLFAPALLAAVLGCREDADSPTAPEATPSLAISATQALAFSQVSGGDRHTCGVTTDNRAYCWGVNDYGQLGDGTTTRRLAPVPVTGIGRRRWRSLAAVSCGDVEDADGRARLDRCDPVFGQISCGGTTAWVRFELTKDFRPWRFSRPLPSTTRPPRLGSQVTTVQQDGQARGGTFTDQLGARVHPDA